MISMITIRILKRAILLAFLFPIFIVFIRNFFPILGKNKTFLIVQTIFILISNVVGFISTFYYFLVLHQTFTFPFFGIEITPVWSSWFLLQFLRGFHCASIKLLFPERKLEFKIYCCLCFTILLLPIKTHFKINIMEQTFGIIFLIFLCLCIGYGVYQAIYCEKIDFYRDFRLLFYLGIWALILTFTL